MNNSDITKEKLVKFFESGCKKKESWKIGTEHEKFGFRKKNLKPINFQDIQVIFKSLEEKFGWAKVTENDLIIGLKKNLSSISLEPGGQIELSGAPLCNLFETCREVNSHHSELSLVSDPLDIDYMGIGFLPKWDLDDIETVPKARYKIMKNYMTKKGKHGLDMMHRTTTIQANLDYESEIDMKNKFRVSLAIQPAVIALYANSPFFSGKLSKFLSYRSWVWKNTDNDRCGVLPMVFDESFSFESYVDYALSVPMYFIKRNEHYYDFSGCSFRDFVNQKKPFESFQITMKDWEDHLTTIFPEVRLKKYLEFRGADGGPWSNVCALPAFWVGLLYDQKNLEELSDIITKWNINQIVKFYDEVSSVGLQAKTPDGKNLKVFIKELLNRSKQGLDRRNIKNSNKNESIFLDPLFEILNKGESQAEIWKKMYYDMWEKNVDFIYKENYFGK